MSNALCVVQIGSPQNGDKCDRVTT
jgi:hypothetical protein